MSDRTCLHCGSDISGLHGNSKYCSPKCRCAKSWGGRPRIPCASCGSATGWPVTRQELAGEVKCKRCTWSPCGTVGAFQRHSRRGEAPCQPCRDAKAEDMREYAVKRKERDGVSLYSQNRKYDGVHGHFIPRADRLAIYERDGWTCQLCGDPVNPELHFNDRMAATLDHIEPQSTALIPDHSSENLRLAHRACNSRRNNKAVDEGGALRVRADWRSTEDLARPA